MKPYNRSSMLLLSVLLAFGAAATAAGQTSESQGQPQPKQDEFQRQNPNLPDQVPDLRFLELTQDQVQKIRIINADLKDERQQATFRLRQARRALAEAVESPTPDETLISQLRDWLAPENVRIVY